MPRFGTNAIHCSSSFVIFCSLCHYCQNLTYMVKCCITQSGSLPHEVSNMDADNAVTYRFYDAFHHDEIGLEAFQGMLLKSGASSSNATKEYVILLVSSLHFF